jgi:MYXO-CTERM domain-containing protein
MKNHMNRYALIAGALAVLLAGTAGAAALSNPPYIPRSVGNEPGDVESGSADDALGPIAHTDQGKAKDSQSIRIPSFVPSPAGGGLDGFTDSAGPSMLGAIVMDEPAQFDLGERTGAPVTSALKLTRADVVQVAAPSGGGFSITPVSTSTIPAPGTGALLVLAGLVGAGVRRRR